MPEAREASGEGRLVLPEVRREEALATLREFLNGRGVGRLFPFCVRTARKLVRQAGAGVGVRLWPQLLRHACAASLLRQGASVGHVNLHLRHVRLDTTKRYLHLTKRDWF